MTNNMCWMKVDLSILKRKHTNCVIPTDNWISPSSRHVWIVKICLVGTNVDPIRNLQENVMPILMSVMIPTPFCVTEHRPSCFDGAREATPSVADAQVTLTMSWEYDFGIKPAKIQCYGTDLWLGSYPQPFILHTLDNTETKSVATCFTHFRYLVVYVQIKVIETQYHSLSVCTLSSFSTSNAQC